MISREQLRQTEGYFRRWVAAAGNQEPQPPAANSKCCLNARASPSRDIRTFVKRGQLITNTQQTRPNIGFRRIYSCARLRPSTRLESMTTPRDLLGRHSRRCRDLTGTGKSSILDCRVFGSNQQCDRGPVQSPAWERAWSHCAAEAVGTPLVRLRRADASDGHNETSTVATTQN